jgi:siderophore synthetase component
MDYTFKKLKIINKPTGGIVPSPETSFLKYYSDARKIAAQNTLVRLIYCAINDKYIDPAEVTFTIAEKDSGKTFALGSKAEALDYLYSRQPDQDIVITMEEKGAKTIVDDPSEFWLWLKLSLEAKLGDNFDPDLWHSAQYAMMESLSKEALSVAKRLDMKQQVASQSAAHANTWDWVVDTHTPDSDSVDTFFYQIGSFAGSQHHPLSKLRRHMTNGRAVDDEKQMLYFAEYGNHFPLPVLAVSKQCLNVYNHESAPDYEQFFRESYPDAHKAWEESLRFKGKDPKDFYPAPLHPLNLRPMKNKLDKWVHSGDILETDATIEVYPNISTRSVRPKDSDAGHIKTTMPEIQLTGYPRSLPFFEASSAPGITHLAKEINKDNGGFEGTLQIIAEPYGFYFTPDKGNDDAAENGIYLSGLFRENPRKLVPADNYVMPLASLISNVGRDEDGHSRSFLADIMKSNSVGDADQAKDYFRDYARTVLTGQLGIFAKYGVSLEAHQQNTYVAFSKKGRLNTTIVQDIVSNTYFYSPVLKYNKKYNKLSDEREEQLMFEPKDMQEPMQQFIHTTLKSHLIPVVAIISREYGIDKHELMTILKKEIERTLECAKKEQEPHLVPAAKEAFGDHLKNIGKALLQDPTLDKAMLTMLLTRTYARVGVEHENAFAAAL